jgi:hypothetical protein
MKGFLLKKISICLLTAFVFSDCRNKPLSAEFIVEKSIEKHGGLIAWDSLEALSFDKNVSLFLKNGTLESAEKQHQVFKFHPQLKGKITWKSNDNAHSIVYKKEQVVKFVNDSLVTDSKELQKAKNSFNASLYVISQPFNFLNKKVNLTYLGVVNLEGIKAHEIKITYQNDTEKSDKWFYYFDVKTFKMVANKVILKDHTSFVENITYDTSTHFIFNQKRKSYRLNDGGEKTYLRATYFYDNFETIYK